METVLERIQEEYSCPSNARTSTSQLSPARVAREGTVTRLSNPSCKAPPRYHRYSKVNVSPSLSSSPTIDADKSSSEVGFNGNMDVEDKDGIEFKTVNVFEFTSIPKSSPSLGITDTCQSSPRTVASLESVMSPSNCA